MSSCFSSLQLTSVGDEMIYLLYLALLQKSTSRIPQIYLATHAIYSPVFSGNDNEESLNLYINQLSV